MTQNKVNVKLTAEDHISGVINRIKGNIGSIGSIAAGATLAVGAMGLAYSASMALTKGIKSASTLQTNVVTGAGDVATLMGTSYATALDVVKSNMKDIANMAAALPGETSGYLRIANSISGGIAKGAKGDLKTYKTDLVDVTKTLGMLAATQSVDMGMAASASNKFVSGTAGLNELFTTNDVFQKNPLFRGYLQEQLKLIGKQEKDWQSLSQEVRNKTIKLAGTKAFAPEMLERLELTTESRFQALKSGLFDPLTGLFGWMREFSSGVEAVGKAKTKTALDSVGRLLKDLTSLGISAAKYLGKLGLSFDPMQKVSEVIEKLSDGLTVIRNIIDQGGDVWQNLSSQFIASVTDALTNTSSTIKAIDWAGLGRGFGSLIGQVLTDPKLAAALEEVLVSSVNSLATAVDQAFQAAIAEVRKGFIKPIEDSVNNTIKDATGGFFGGDEKKPNGYQKVLKVAGDDIDKVKKAVPFVGGIIDGLGAGIDLFRPKTELPQASPLSNQSKTELPPVSSLSNQSNANTFAPVIQLTAMAGSDMQGTADYMLSELNKQFLQYKDATLT